MIPYAIPSRARADVLVSKTLPLLRRLEIPDAAITVFVAEEEIEEYQATIEASDFRPWLAPGALGVCANRNAITDHFEDGARYISVDDDIRDLRAYVDATTLRPVEPEEWAGLVEEGFEMCESTGARLWGLYPVQNPYFMRRRISTRLTLVAGGVVGIVNRRDAHRVDLEYRDDWQRCVQCYEADGALVRFDFVTWSTENYRGAGGLQEDGKRTYEATLADCKELVRRHPGLVTLNLTKKSGWPETRLRDRRPAGQGSLAT